MSFAWDHVFWKQSHANHSQDHSSQLPPLSDHVSDTPQGVLSPISLSHHKMLEWVWNPFYPQENSITCSKSNAIYIAEPGFGFNSISKGWALKHYAVLLHRILALEGTQQIIRLNPYSLQMRTPRPREGAWLAHMTNKNATNFTEHQDPLHNLRASVVPGHPKSGLRLLFSVSPASLLLVTRNFWIDHSIFFSSANICLRCSVLRAKDMKWNRHLIFSLKIKKILNLIKLPLVKKISV